MKATKTKSKASAKRQAESDRLRKLKPDIERIRAMIADVERLYEGLVRTYANLVFGW